MPDPLEELRAAIHSAAGSLRDGAPDRFTPTLERPPQPELGDYSTNAAMLLAPNRGEAPREVAELLREELVARMGGREPPDDGYAGDYVVQLAGELSAAGVDAADLDGLARRGTEAMRGRIEASLERFGVRFNTWFSERSLHDGGMVEVAIDTLRGRGHVYESEGAVWLRTSAFGDDKDRVLVRSDGEPTYFAADIAYHLDKFERGAERLIDPVGADHHGYVPRMRAAIEALGHDPDLYEAPIMQFVRLVEGGERARMSKRKGEFAALDDLIDDIGVDAARFFMLQRSHDTALDLDLDLARRQSQDNPVYYVQYAHARIASILRKAVAEGSAPAVAGGGETVDEAALAAAAAGEPSLAAPAEPSERALVQRLLELPEEAAAAGDRR